MNNKISYKGKTHTCGLLLILLFSIILLITSGGCTVTGKSELDGISLNLPDEYYIEADVITTSEFGTQKTTYALSRAEDRIYIKLGYDREQYVYKQISDGKYIEYKYDTGKGKYLPTMISDALQAQIDAGNIPIESVSVGKESIDARIQTLDQYFCAYKTLTAALSYSGTETVNGIDCRKYNGKINAVLTKSELEFLIDPETGLAMRYLNKTKSGIVTTFQKTEINVFSKEARIPSV